jgi:putative transposase
MTAFHRERKRMRLPYWDYGWKGLYFITICTKDRVHYFGTIKDSTFLYSEIGNVVVTEWLNTFYLRPAMNLTMDAYQVMPNHFHAVIGIGANNFNKPDIDAEVPGQFLPPSMNLASVIRGFKSAVTVYARKNNIPFQWHGKYHDYLIRNDLELLKIRKYIQNNVKKWKGDRFGP